MSQWGRYPSFRQFQSALRAKFGSLVSGTAVDQGAGSANFQSLYQNGARTPQIETRVDSGATVTPTASDHGKTIICTSAGTVTTNLPAISAVFEGFRFGLINAQGGVTGALPGGRVNTVNRNGADTIDPSATSITVPATDGLNRNTFQVINGKWYTLEPRWSVGPTISSITFGSRHTLAHFLGGTPNPKNVDILMRCVTTELGYEVDDLIPAPRFAVQSTGAAGFGGHIQTDGTNVYYDLGANGIYVNREDTFGAATTITAGNWNIYAVTFY